MGAGFDEIEQVGIGVARFLLPLGLKKFVDTAAPVHDCSQSLGLYVSQLGSPVTAETGADHGKPIGIDFGPAGQISQRRDIDLMSLGGRQQRTFACAVAVEYTTLPSLLRQ